MTLSLEISPRPKVDVRLAAELAIQLFGVEGPVTELSSHQDRNFRIGAANGDLVLKVHCKHRTPPCSISPRSIQTSPYPCHFQLVTVTTSPELRWMGTSCTYASSPTSKEAP
jgi:hypothetical protein